MASTNRHLKLITTTPGDELIVSSFRLSARDIAFLEGIAAEMDQMHADGRLPPCAKKGRSFRAAAFRECLDAKKREIAAGKPAFDPENPERLGFEWDD